MITRSRIAAACTLLGAGLFVMAVLAAPAVAAVRSVAVKYYAFSPSTITIRVGDTITWTNVDPVFEHDVSSSSFKSSGTLSPGDSYTYKFRTAGTFGYRCSIHLNPAKVVVTTPATPQPTRRPTPKPTRAPTPRPTPSPSPSLSPSASASPTASATASATQTSTPSTSSAIALSSTSTASSPAGPATPAADANSPSIVLILVVALSVAGVVGVGALVVRRR